MADPAGDGGSGDVPQGTGDKFGRLRFLLGNLQIGRHLKKISPVSPNIHSLFYGCIM